MADDLYQRDIVAWAEAQGEALRRRSANEIDWENLAEEVETLGRSETRAVESQIINILAHFLKIEFLGRSDSIAHWRGEIQAFRIELDRDMTPSLLARAPARLDALYEYAVRLLKSDHLKRGETAPDYPAVCPYSWSDVVGRGEEWAPQPRE